MKRYNIALKNKSDQDNFCNEMVSVGATNNYVPDRSCELLSKFKHTSNATFILTDDEVKKLEKDPRVLAINQPFADKNYLILTCEQQIEDEIKKSEPLGIFKSDRFFKYENPTKNHLDAIKELKKRIYNQPNQSINTIQSLTLEDKELTIQNLPGGADVDIIIFDEGHLDPDNPEYSIKINGIDKSRVFQIDWFSLLDTGVFPSRTEDFQYPYGPTYADPPYRNHASHCAGIAAGKLFGWAKKANIYTLSYGWVDNTGNWIGPEAILEFHNNKPINPRHGNKNPTIVNMSFGFAAYKPINKITKVVYRGVTYNAPNGGFTGEQLANYGLISFNSYIIHGVRGDATIDSQIQAMLDAGIILVGAAGNYFHKIDVVGGADYNNHYYYLADGQERTEYYHRGSGPTSNNGVICVGSLSNYFNGSEEYKSVFSETGPGVDVYAPGENIVSCIAGKFSDNSDKGYDGAWSSSYVEHPDNPNYRIRRMSGTSMACPQVVGALACYAESNRELTPEQAMNFIKDNAISAITSVGSNYNDFRNLQGGTNKILHYPNISIATSLSILTNASFETTTDGTTSQYIPGWTTYGVAKSSISVEIIDGGPALKISSTSKAFCFELPIDPAQDYILSFRAKASNARPKVEFNPTSPSQFWIPEPTQSNFDWRNFTFTWSASARGNVKEVWIALLLEWVGNGATVWFKDVKLEPVGGGINSIPNSTFSETVIETTVPNGWSIYSGVATVSLDQTQSTNKSRSLKVSGVGQPVRIAQSFNLDSVKTQGIKRVKISAWGKSNGLGSDRVKLEVYGANTSSPTILNLSGDTDWTKGEIILNVDLQSSYLLLWVNAPRPFLGDAWFDDIRIEAVEDSEVVNLLSNPSFLPSVANPNIPDYWGVWGDATLGIDPWTLDFFSIVDEISPVASAGVIKIRYPSTGNFVPKPGSNQLSMYLLTGSPLSLVPGTYTFSIYAKADRSNTIINIQHPSKFFATAQVGTEWQRITATSTDFALLPSIHIQDPNSTVWFSAPQLEAGSNATSFRKPPGQGITSNPSLSSNVSATLKSTIRNHTISKIYRERAANVVQPLTIYTEYDYVLNETNVRARLIWSGNGQTTIQWKLISANGTDLTTIQSINLSKPGIHTFNVPISGLSAGVITIQATAYSSGSVVGMASNNFRKLNNVARDVRVNRFTRSLRVNNEPFIPLFLPINPTDVTDWHLNRFKTAGFNCLVGTPGTLLQSEIINNSVPLSKINNINQQLDKLHAAGMGLFWPIQWSLNDWWNNKNFYDGNISGLANTYQWIVSTFKNHPAILGWYIMDEPSVSDWETNSGFSESNVKDLWLAVKTSDPGRPAYVNWNHSWQISPYGGFECTDILSHDDYSLSGETFDYGELLSNVRMVNNSQVGRKPTFEFISGSYDEVLMRPSAAALRVHAWLHLVHGTRGFGYWSKIPMDPQVWAEMRTFNENSADLHNLILGNPDAVLRTSSIPSSTIQYAMWTVDDFAYLIAVNTAYCDQTLNIDVASFCERTVSSAIKLYSSGSINSVDGILNDNIGPLNYCVYRFVLEPGT